MPGLLAVLAHVPGQQPGRPQLLRIAQILRLDAGQRHDPGPRLRSDPPRTALARQVGQRRQSPQLQPLVDAALHLGPVRAQFPCDRRHAPAVGIGEQDPRPFGALHRFGARADDRFEHRPHVVAECEAGSSAGEGHRNCAGAAVPRRYEHKTFQRIIAILLWNRSTSLWLRSRFFEVLRLSDADDRGRRAFVKILVSVTLPPYNWRL